MGVFKRGGKFWIDYRVDGVRVRTPVGTRISAVKALAKVRESIEAETYSRTATKAPLFEDAVEVYVRDRCAKGRRATSYCYLQSVWTKALKGRKLGSITKIEIERRLTKWKRALCWSGGTRNRAAAQLAGFLSYAIAEDWIERHPMKGRVKLLPESKGRVRWLNPDEIDRLATAARSLPGLDPAWREVLADVIVFACASGLRFGALCGVRRADYADGFIVIDVDKSGERLHVPVEGAIAVLVQRRVAAAATPTSYLFPGPAGGNARGSIRRHLPAVVRAAGLEWGRYMQDAKGNAVLDADGCRVLNEAGLTFHTFRHTAATAGFRAGVRDPVVQRLMGWRTPAMLQRYRHIGDDDLQAGAALLAAMVAPGRPLA